MSIALVLLIGAVAWLRFSARLSGAVLNRLVAAGIGLLALRLGFGGSPPGGLALAGLAAAILWSGGERTARAAAEARARAALGVGATAGAEDIRAAYLKRAATAHPDRGGTDAAMQELNAARDLLLRRAPVR